jgi:hypothetical protein
VTTTVTPLAPAVAIAGWSNAVTYKSGDFVAQNNVLWISIQGNNLNNTPPAPTANTTSQIGLQGNLFWSPALDQSHPAVTVEWVWTFTAQDPNGISFESLPSPVTTGTGPLSSDRNPPIQFSGLTGGLPAGWTVLTLRLYRGPANGVHGFVQEYAYTGGTIVVPDQGGAPDYTRQPPKGTDPFLVNGADQFPAVIGYLDQRRLFAGGAGLSSGLAFSKDGDLYNWDDKNVPGADTDSIRLLLISEVLEQVRSFVSLARGIVLTSQGEFAVSGVNGGALSRSSRSAVRQSTWGSSWLNPIRIGKGLLFNTAKSNQVRDFYPLYGLYTDNWDGQDLTVMVRDLFDNFTLADWDFQTVPYPVVRGVRSDGTLLGLVYQHAPPSFGQQLTEGAVAWGLRKTGIGYDAFENVCVVPEPPEDAVYYVVRRVVNGATVRFIEREVSPSLPFVPALYAPAKIPTVHLPGNVGIALPDARYGVFLDAAISYDGHVDPTVGANAGFLDSVTSPGSMLAADYAAGQQVTFTHANGLFLNTDPGTAQIVLDPENVNGLGTVRMQIVAFTNANKVTCIMLDNLSQTALQFLWGFSFAQSSANWAIARSSFAAAHLSGYQGDSADVKGQRGVWVLADGNAVPFSGFTWAGGVMVLQNPAVVVTIGIANNSDVEFLDAFHPSIELRNKKKTLKRIGFELADSRDLWVGRDLNTLEQFMQRTVAMGYANIPLQTGYFEKLVQGSTDKDGRAAARHFTPLPCTITSILREYELGDT